MHYELFLRREAGLDETIAAAAEGRGLRVERIERDGTLYGIDIGVVAEAQDAAKGLCSTAFELAESHALAVYDPQLARAVTRADEDAIAEQIARTHAFTAAGLSSLDATPRIGSRAAAKGWTIVGLTIVALIVLARVLRCAI